MKFLIKIKLGFFVAISLTVWSLPVVIPSPVRADYCAGTVKCT